MLAIDNKELGRLEPAAALEKILTELGTLTLSEETIALNRLVLGECDRFPEIATTFYEAAILQANRAIEGWLRRQCARGMIRVDDPQTAAGILRGMMIMEPQRAASRDDDAKDGDRGTAANERPPPSARAPRERAAEAPVRRPHKRSAIILRRRGVKRRRQ